MTLAQLIKLQDYISRYQTNIYQYPSQYMRLKKENWTKMNHLFKQGRLEESIEEEEETVEVGTPKWKQLFRKTAETEASKKNMKKEVSIPKTTYELKKYFLNGLFPFQIKWASTTLKEKSFVNRKYYDDELLKYYLHRFPDTYFIMYQPIVELKRAKMEVEPILIGPYGVEIIYYLDLPSVERVEPTSENSWIVETKGIRTKILNPMLALNRSETFVRSVWNAYGIDFPVRKVILAPDLSFMDGQEPYGTDFIDRDRYQQWLNEKRKLSSPLKHNQLKASEALLKHCKTTSVKRPEWEEEEWFTEE